MLDINFNQIIEKRKNSAYRKVNEEMILLYLEVGKDFIFIGDEYRVQVGNHDFFIDLLFYNIELSCLVAFELKLGEFKAEYLGKMNLYLEALDRDVKKEQENPSVGVILCSSKDEDVVEYSISKNMSQTMISEYKLKLIDKKLLETKLKEMKNLIDNEKTVGYMMVHFSTQKCAKVNGIYVFPDCQKRGYAKKALLQVLEELRKQKYDYAFIQTRTHNKMWFTCLIHYILM